LALEQTATAGRPLHQSRGKSCDKARLKAKLDRVGALLP